MITRSSDTHPEVEKRQISMIRNLTPAQKILKVHTLSESTILLSRRASKRANPALSEKDLILKIIFHHYGEKLANSFRKFLDERK